MLVNDYKRTSDMQLTVEKLQQMFEIKDYYEDMRKYKQDMLKGEQKWKIERAKNGQIFI